MAQTVKNLPAIQETLVLSLSWEDVLEKEMAIHSSILAWRIPWTVEPGGLQSMGILKSQTWATNTFTLFRYYRQPRNDLNYIGGLYTLYANTFSIRDLSICGFRYTQGRGQSSNQSPENTEGGLWWNDLFLTMWDDSSVLLRFFWMWTTLKNHYWICYTVASVLCLLFLALRHVGS